MRAQLPRRRNRSRARALLRTFAPPVGLLLAVTLLLTLFFFGGQVAGTVALLIVIVGVCSGGWLLAIPALMLGVSALAARTQDGGGADAGADAAPTRDVGAGD